MGAAASSSRRMAYAVGAVAATTVLAFLAHTYLQIADIVVLYMCCITVVATRLERPHALAATVLSVACLDFFFVNPRYSFTVDDVRYVGTFGMMLGVGWLVANLAGRIRKQAREAEARERDTAALSRLGDLLAQRGEAHAIQEQAEAFLRTELGIPVLVLLPDAEGTLQGRPWDGAGLNREELASAQWAMENRQATGAGTATLPGSRALFLPMGAPEHPVGAVAFIPGGRPLGPRRDLLEAMANQISLTLERARLASERHDAWLRAEQEHLRSILLSTISHDLRTPLGTISGATSTLLDPGPEATAEDRRMLLLSIHQESMRLERLVNNLLDLTRIETGHVQVKKEWVPMEEIIGSALTRMEAQLGDRPVKLDLGETWVPLDPVLLEQVLVNLLDNALKFSPAGSPLEIDCRSERDEAVLTLTDRGLGFAPGEEERVFEKLYRGSRSTDAPGAGLGLAICRGIIQAHGGAISAQTAPGGGARVIITLPIAGTPPILPVEG
jgi:two-component system sensor histidine kinase KdpD